MVGCWQGGVTLLSCRGIRAQIKDSEDVTSKMHGCDIDIKVTLSESLICALGITYWYHTCPRQEVSRNTNGEFVISYT